MGGSERDDETLTSLARAVHPTNADLIGDCLLGSQRAWSQIVDKYERLIWSIALREGLDPTDAGDVAQDTFGHLLNSLASIQNPERLGQWLATVTRREVWRRQRLNARVELELDAEGIEPSPDFVDEVIRSAEIYEAVQQLGMPCRGLIIGLFFDPAEPDYASLSVRLGRPIGSIGPLRGRCLQELRAILEGRAT